MKTILMFEFWNVSPHLETALELAKSHLECGDKVYFFFCGHDVPYKKFLRPAFPGSAKALPEVKGASLISHPHFFFHPRVSIRPAPFESIKFFSSLDSLMSYKYKDCSVGLAAASSLVSSIKLSCPDLSQYAYTISRMIHSGASVYDFATDLMRELIPDLIYTFNGRFVNYKSIVDAASAAGISCFFHERGSNKDRYSARDYPPHDVAKIQHDIMSTWRRNGSEKIAIDYFSQRRKGRSLEWLSFSSSQEKNLLPTLQENKKIITYFSSTDDEFIAVGNLCAWDRWPSQDKAIESLINICKGMSNVLLIIKQHPNLSSRPRSEIKRKCLRNLPSNVLLIEPSSPVDTYALISRSDVVVVSSSTVGIEAVAMSVPAICLGPNLYSNFGGVYLPNNDQELMALLQSDQLSVHPRLADPYGFYMATFGQQYKYYKAESFFSGSFMGRQLQPSALKKLLNRLWVAPSLLLSASLDRFFFFAYFLMHFRRAIVNVRS